MNLSDLANKLLDLGKRNRLLNYKETGLKSIDVLNKNLKDIYFGLTNSKDFTILPHEPLLERYHKTFASIEEQDKDIVNEYSALKVYDICKEALKPNQLLCYKKGYKLEKVLKALMKEYNYSVNEKGINSLYLTFNFVSYVEDKTTYRAPLLLIPVEFSKNASGIYKIHAADDDIILNPTLDYYFNTFRHFDIPDYTDQDFDYDTYMEDIKKVLPEDVIFEEGMSLGIYSFLKMNMYKDLMDHEAKVLENKNIEALLGNPALTEEVLEGEVLPVVNCDSSQLEAIKMAVSGKSFCLQGPPGSGKSQTITNIIASLIGNNRHVLFVSEKLQALQVVYENLRRAGLAEFAIELHSSKANKKAFIDELYKTANLGKYQISNFAEDTKEQYEITKNFISSYKKALSSLAKGENITLYELLSSYSQEEGEAIPYRILNLDNYKMKDIDEASRYLREYKDAITPLGYDYKDTVFYGFKDMNSSYVSYEMEKEFMEVIPYLNHLISYRNTLNTYLVMDKKTNKEVLSVEDLYTAFEFISIYNKIAHSDLISLNQEQMEYVIEKAKKYLDLKTYTEELDQYDKEILNEDLPRMYRTYRSYTGLFKAFNRDYRSLKRHILSFRHEKAKDKILLAELKVLAEIKENLIERKSLREEIEEYIPYISNENIRKVIEDLEALLPYAKMKVKCSKEECINTLLDTMLSFKNYQDGDICYRKLAVRFDVSILDFYHHPIDIVLSHLKQMFESKDKFLSYVRVLSAMEQLKKCGFVEYLDSYLELKKPLIDMDKSLRKTYLQNKILNILEQTPEFAGFSTNLFKERVDDFISLDEKLLKLNRDYIIAVNSKNRPDELLMEGSKYKVLAKEANKIRKQKPVRVLLSEIYDFAVTIKPVFLMSPLSVSTYLTEDNQFDCVIFDEASQIFAQDAFGAIYRGKQCIIIGDSKQMPPSNFFNASLDMEDDEDYDSGLESILDMATSYMATRSLKWHYRSRSEELIAFSNGAFYDHTLITIPEARKHEAGFGIDFVYIDNGIYDAKTRTNVEEARRITDMVIDHYKHSDKSLGVVAFSKVQADLIEEMVEKKIQAYPEINKFFTKEVEEPFFVKNLETVQGDERDRIIFSVCYGYNADGKFYQRFGPLNNLGGERRLNVAITRSKYNITIVSSIRHTDIKDTTTDSIGVKLLKEYLEFAENIETKQKYSPSEDGITNSIKEFLEENHYIVYTNYGTSSFRIPIAIKEEEDSNFVAAIMIDGLNHNSNITDTSRLEKLLLERQGWKYYKLYSVGYIKNKKEEEQRILDFLRDSTVKDIEVKEEDTTFIEAVDASLDSHFIKYEAMPDATLMRNYMNKDLCYAMTEFLKVEEPVHKDYYLKKAAIAMGKTRVSNVVRNEVAKAYPLDLQIIGDTYWLNPREEVTLRIHSLRMLNEIPMEELKSGLYTIISLSNGITVEGAFKGLIKLLGFSRLTENTKKILNDAIVYLKLDGKIIQKGECLYI